MGNKTKPSHTVNTILPSTLGISARWPGSCGPCRAPLPIFSTAPHPVPLAREALVPRSMARDAPLQCTCLAHDMETFLNNLSVLQARLVGSVLHAATGTRLNRRFEATVGGHQEL